MSSHIYSLLCLGDSYTIGEGVSLHESFPYQVLQLLRNTGYHFHAPEIVAKTGWTTTELAEHLIHNKLEDHYDFVTLLIGVNNQYREQDIDDYADDFEFLVKKAIHLAKGHAQCVMVISIPDWSVSPFASGKNKGNISKEIAAYNEVNESIAFKYDCTYCDITTGKKTKEVEGLFAGDGLHYSQKEHERWATKITGYIKELIT